MTGSEIEKIRDRLAKRPPPDDLSIEERRNRIDRAERVFETPPEISVQPASLNGVSGERLTPPDARDKAALLYLHGGGYGIGSSRSHRHLAAGIARAAGLVTYVPDYRLAPENPYPAAVEDALSVYRALLEDGADPGRLAVMGDSAGGGLTLALMLSLRDRALPLPAATACLSPWVDLAVTGQSVVTKAAVDPLTRPDALRDFADGYLGGADPRTPGASPMYADLTGLPPLLIHVGSEEVLLDDATGLAARAEADGVDVTLQVWPDMIHVFHWFWSTLREGNEAIGQIGTWLRDRCM